jgi:hypothetical protein
MEMKKVMSIFFALTCITLVLSIPASELSGESPAQLSAAPEWLVIDGLVQTPLNLSYAELKEFPQISEVANLSCITPRRNVINNWTGVPLFYILSMARVISGGYREAIFNGSDGYAQGVLLETAMDPTSILAFYGNGTDLEQMEGFGSGYRVAFPCRWGYKWVARVVHITIVDYVYGGANPALMPNCIRPSTQPSIETFNASGFGDGAFQVLSNMSIESFNYDYGLRLSFNATGTEGSTGYFYITFPSQALIEPYQVYVDQNQTDFQQTETTGNTYLYLEYPSNPNTTIRINGLGALRNGGGGTTHYMQ